MECNPEPKAGHRIENRMWSSKKLPKSNNHRWALLLGGAAQEPTNQHRDYTTKFVLFYVSHLLLWDGLLCTQGMGRTTAPASPCCPFQCLSNGKWSPRLPCSLSPAILEEVPGVWCHKLHSFCPGKKGLEPHRLHCMGWTFRGNGICMGLRAWLFNWSFLCSYFYC